MKSLYFLITLIVLIPLVFINCQKSEYPSQPQSSEQNDFVGSIGKKPRGKPQHQAPMIELFEIFDNQNNETVFLVENDIIKSQDDLFIDLSNDRSYRISYKVTHPTDVAYVRVFLGYDENCDYELQFGPHEFGVWMINDDREGENDVSVEGEISNWTGQVMCHAWCSNLYPNNEFTLFDQLATYYENGDPTINPDQYEKADHFIFFIWTESTRGVNEKSSFFWIKAANPPSDIYHVDLVEAWGEPVGRIRVQTKAKVKVVYDSDGNPPVEGAIVYGKWSGVYTSGYFRSGVTDYDGIARLTDGPEIKNNLSGEEVFTVYAVRYPDGAYNPYENSEWTWPNERAHDFFTMPIP